MESKSAPPGCCRLCLSTERDMCTAADAVWAYHAILGLGADEESYYTVQSQHATYNLKQNEICWECKATLLRIQRFKQQASKAQRLLDSGNIQQSLTKLAVFTNTSLDIAGTSTASNCEYKLELVPKVEIDDDAEDVWAGSVHFSDDDIKEEIMYAEVKKDQNLKFERGEQVIESKVMAVESKVTRKKRKKSYDQISKLERSEQTIESKTTSSQSKVNRKKRKKFKEATVKKEKKKVAKRNICGANCRNRKTIERLRIDGSSEKHTCIPCDLTFENVDDWIKHDEEKHLQGAQPPCECNREKRRNKKFPYIPLPARNSETGTLDCDQCDAKVKTGQYYRRHYQMHISDQRHECDICNKVFKLRSQIQNHMKTHNPKNILCEICGKPHRSVALLKIHMYTHSGLEVRPHKCHLCPRTFITTDKLKVHSIYHTGVKAFKCDLCAYSFYVKYELTKHLRLHHGVGESTASKTPVPRTRSMFRNKRLGTTEKNNSGGKPLTARGERAYVKDLRCNICGKKFSQKVCLDAHRVVHTGDRPFKCEECGQAFKFQSNVLTHIRSMHTAEKTHECPTCGARFRLRGNLTAHLKTHSGEKPFSCDICNQKFIRARNLRNHYKVHMK